jgi:hypothetical protein
MKAEKKSHGFSVSMLGTAPILLKKREKRKKEEPGPFFSKEPVPLDAIE